jgi:hypothetical protein
MATGYTQSELDTLLQIMDAAVPPIPSIHDTCKAARVKAMRMAVTDRGALFNLETVSGTGLYWLNCWVTKELAGAISYASQSYGWAKRGMKPEPSGHLKDPQPADLNSAADVVSLSSLGDPEGMRVRFAVADPVKYLTLFFPVRAALEAMLCITEGGMRAAWWDDEFELIPSRKSQH